MSTTTSTTTAPRATETGNDGVRVYRGSSLSELLPQIRAELGDHAVVLREREGLAGGVGGFFQKAFVEVEARAGGPRVDVYDERDEAEPDSDSGSGSAPGDGFPSLLAEAYDAGEAFVPDTIPAAVEQAVLPALAAAENRAAARKAPVPAAGELSPAVTAQVPRSRAAAAAERTLAEHGLSAALATEIVGETVTHLLPFGSARGLKRLVRGALARRLASAPPPATGRATIALAGAAGSGSTPLAAGLAAAYAAAGDLPVACIALRPADGGASLRGLLEGAGVEVHVARDTAEARAAAERLGERGIAIVDLPAVAPRDEAAVRTLKRECSRLAVTERHVVMPATLGRPAARELLERLRPLSPTALALTQADETAGIGAVLELAIDAALPLSYVATSEGVAPADPQALAGTVLP